MYTYFPFVLQNLQVFLRPEYMHIMFLVFEFYFFIDNEVEYEVDETG